MATKLSNSLSLTVALSVAALLLSACTKTPPQNPKNICNVFQEYPSWYWYAKRTQERWGMSIPVQMAIMYQESSLNGASKPPRGKILWVIPWKRPSSAYGYSQALTPTWNNYIASTGNTSASRNDFGDASDFVGWYANITQKKLGISVNDAYDQYLAYHEGAGGYARGTYNSKQWLVFTAQKVQSRANLFAGQLQSCQNNISKPFWMYLTSV